MSTLIRTQSQALQALNARSPSRMVSRQGVRAVRAEVEEALVAATRLEGTAYLTHLALSHVGLLSTMESQIITSTPAADPIHKEQVARRVSMLVDNYTATAAAEIARRGF